MPGVKRIKRGSPKKAEKPGSKPGGENTDNSPETMSEVIKGLAGSAMSGLVSKGSGLVSGLGTAYIAGELLDMVGGAASDYFDDSEEQELTLAREKMGEQRKARKDILGFYKASEADSQRRMDRKEGIEDRAINEARIKEFIANVEGRGMDMIERGQEGGEQIQETVRGLINSRYGPAAANQDVLLPVMMELTRRQAEQMPSNALLVAGIGM